MRKGGWPCWSLVEFGSGPKDRISLIGEIGLRIWVIDCFWEPAWRCLLDFAVQVSWWASQRTVMSQWYVPHRGRGSRRCADCGTVWWGYVVWTQSKSFLEATSFWSDSCPPLWSWSFSHPTDSRCPPLRRITPLRVNLASLSPFAVVCWS